MQPPEPRKGLVVVAGFAASAVTEAVDALLPAAPGTVVVHHDLHGLSEGVLRRRVRFADRDHTTAVELAHGCMSCTLREDLLPLLAMLARRQEVRRIVLHLDPRLEPETICWALHHVVLAGTGATVGDSLRIEALLTVVDTETWLSDVGGEEELAERGLAVTADDDRTVAQVVVGQAEFADALVLTGVPQHAWRAARTTAVLDRLVPGAPRARLEDLDAAALLEAVPADARRGRPDDPHGPILRGRPPLEPEVGCTLTVFSARRPFHPQRLHATIDVLLDGVVRTRGRVWVASQPDTAMWVESAGGGLRIGNAGPWLAALDESTWHGYSAERRAMAALRWDPYYGDRGQDLAILAHRANPAEITRTLEAALLSDAELAEGQDAWLRLSDPFGGWQTTTDTTIGGERS